VSLAASKVDVSRDTLQVTGGPLREGETALVTAAAGGTGHFGTQLALLDGCRVVATAGGNAKAERLRRLGVHRVIDYKREARAYPT